MGGFIDCCSRMFLETDVSLNVDHHARGIDNKWSNVEEERGRKVEEEPKHDPSPSDEVPYA